MAVFKKISDSQFPIDKEVVVCGKGHSLIKVKDLPLEDKVVCCLNSAILFVDKVDYLVVTDWERLEVLLREETNFSKVKNILVPIQMHHCAQPSKYTYLDAMDKLKSYDLNVYTFHLVTQKIPNPDSNEIDFIELGPEPSMSSLSVSLHWLTNLGFKNFKIFGVSKNGVYEQKFEEIKDVGTPSPNNTSRKVPVQWFIDNYNNAIKILERQQCKFDFF